MKTSLKSLTAVIFAAGFAALFVGILPPPAPAAAAIQNSKHDVIAAGKTETPAPRAAEHRAGCTEAWPYYEASCLRDAHVHEGVSTTLRVVSVAKPAKARIQTAQR